MKKLFITLESFVEDSDSRYKELSERIIKFVDKYAGLNPNYEEDDKNSPRYTSPDTYELLTAADLLSQGIKPKKCFSDWGSGGYKPYLSKEGREEHDAIIKDIYRIIHQQ